MECLIVQPLFCKSGLGFGLGYVATANASSIEAVLMPLIVPHCTEDQARSFRPEIIHHCLSLA
jgi:hypothetical protein